MNSSLVRRRLRGSLAVGVFCVSGILLRAQSASPETPASPPPATATSAPSIFDEEPVSITSPRIPDKMERVNRAVFKFNDALYKVTLRPLSKGYAAVMPAPVRRGIGRFFHNLAYPTRLAGNLLEGRFRDAGTETERFFVNTFTSLGFLATADKFPDLPERPSDLGQAFGTWGLGHGTYLVLPLLGPSSLRDGIGMGISGYFLDPPHYLQEWEYRAAARAVAVTNESPDQMNAYDQLKAASVDPYVALRDAYSARRTRRPANETQAPAIPTTPTPTRPPER